MNENKIKMNSMYGRDGNKMDMDIVLYSIYERTSIDGKENKLPGIYSKEFISPVIDILNTNTDEKTTFILKKSIITDVDKSLEVSRASYLFNNKLENMDDCELLYGVYKQFLGTDGMPVHEYIKCKGTEESMLNMVNELNTSCNSDMRYVMKKILVNDFDTNTDNNLYDVYIQILGDDDTVIGEHIKDNNAIYTKSNTLAIIKRLNTYASSKVRYTIKKVTIDDTSLISDILENALDSNILTDSIKNNIKSNVVHNKISDDILSSSEDICLLSDNKSNVMPMIDFDKLSAYDMTTNVKAIMVYPNDECKDYISSKNSYKENIVSINDIIGHNLSSIERMDNKTVLINIDDMSYKLYHEQYCCEETIVMVSGDHNKYTNDIIKSVNIDFIKRSEYIFSILYTITTENTIYRIEWEISVDPYCIDIGNNIEDEPIKINFKKLPHKINVVSDNV